MAGFLPAIFLSDFRRIGGRLFHFWAISEGASCKLRDHRAKYAAGGTPPFPDSAAIWPPSPSL